MTPAQMYAEIIKVARIGDVINFDSRGANFFMRWIFRQIRKAQKKMGFKLWRDIHSVLVLWIETTNRKDKIVWVLSATVPNVVIESLKISDRTLSITVCRLRASGEGFSEEWIQTMREAANNLVGHPYDWLDMLAIKLRLQKWPSWITGLLDLGRKRVVCSGAVQYCLLKAWAYSKDAVARSLNGLAPNRVTPAHFVNHDESFEIVTEVKA